MLIISCEHATACVPHDLRAYFYGKAALLASHRGFDPGALTVARALARRVRASFFYSRVSRLVVDCNRSPRNPRRFSAISATMPAAVKRRIVERYYDPYRGSLCREIDAALSRNEPVLHCSIHSFTPVLRGRRRHAALGLLYDPARRGEKTLCACLRRTIESAVPSLRVRYNYPYRGTADGLTTFLRTLYPAQDYYGIEIEINQQLLARRRTDITALLLSGLEQCAPRFMSLSGPASQVINIEKPNNVRISHKAVRV